MDIYGRVYILLHKLKVIFKIINLLPSHNTSKTFKKNNTWKNRKLHIIRI